MPSPVVTNDTGPVNGSAFFHQGFIEPTLPSANIEHHPMEHPMNHPTDPVNIPQAFGGPVGEEYSFPHHLYGNFNPGYQMPVGLNQYSVAENVNNLASAGSLPSSHSGYGTSPSAEPLAAVHFAGGLNKDLVQGNQAALYNAQLSDLLDETFRNAVPIFGGVNGYPYGVTEQSLPSRYYDEQQFDNSSSYHLAAQDGTYYNSGLVGSLPGEVIVEPTSAPAYVPIQGALLNSSDPDELAFDDDTQHAQAPSALDAKAKKSGKKQPGDRKAYAHRGDKGFSVEIHNRIIEFVEKFRETQQMSTREVNQRIYDTNARTLRQDKVWSAFLDQVTNLCPGRDRTAVMKHCRRYFHPFGKRGVWTAEEDAELREVIKTHANKWTTISKIIDRHPEDIRDHYRNYLSEADIKEGRWSEEELSQLSTAMAECEAEQRAKYRLKTGQSDAGLPRDTFLKAELIAKKMPTRKRIQVQYRMKRMQDDQDKTLEQGGPGGEDQAT
ncbi:MAG: RNA polymerase I enhancer binding protein [Peltula sp. TS41687]|nr:MAG: RNA polymerase I enhancer binding protein [Peltula sp. TS41687]